MALYPSIFIVPVPCNTKLFDHAQNVTETIWSHVKYSNNICHFIKQHYAFSGVQSVKSAVVI